MYATYMPEPECVGTLWGIDVKGIRAVYYDKARAKHFVLDLKDGLCGIEDEPET